MGRRCTICDHVKRPLIEATILEGRRPLDVASEFALTRRQVDWHWKYHMRQDSRDALSLLKQEMLDLPPSITPARQERLIRTLSAADEFLDLLDRVKAIMDSSGSEKIQIAAIGEARALLDTMIDLALIGKGEDGGMKNVTGSADPPWRRVREVLVHAGEKYPEARDGLEYALELLADEA